MREKKRKLWKWSAEKRENKENKILLSYFKLFINGDAYAWNAKQRSGVLVKGRSGAPQQISRSSNDPSWNSCLLGNDDA